MRTTNTEKNREIFDLVRSHVNQSDYHRGFRDGKNTTVAAILQILDSQNSDTVDKEVLVNELKRLKSTE